MNLPLTRLFPQAQTQGRQLQPAERRREPRHSAGAQATVQFVSGSQVMVQLADVSLHGCCVRGETDRLQQGRIVSIGLHDNPMIDGIVRWVRADTVGLEFLRPIPVERLEWHDLMDTGFGD